MTYYQASTHSIRIWMILRWRSSRRKKLLGCKQPLVSSREQLFLVTNPISAIFDSLQNICVFLLTYLQVGATHLTGASTEHQSEMK